MLLRHLRYFTEPVWFWVALVQPFGVYAGFAMVAGLAGLWARRFLVERIRYISTPSDHLMLALLLASPASGLAMKFVAHTDIVGVKAFFLGLMCFDWQPLPADPAAVRASALVALLMIVFPFSKLLHAPGVFFSPSRNQVDDPRERAAPGAVGRAARPEELNAETMAADVKAPPLREFPGVPQALRPGRDGRVEALRRHRQDAAGARLPRRAGRGLGGQGDRPHGRAAGQVPLAQGLSRRLRALRRLHRQVPLLHRHRRPARTCRWRART